MADLHYLQETYLALAVKDRLGTLNLEVDVNFSHAWTVLFGPSGSGKSTLLRILCGLQKSDNSVVEFHGIALQSIPPHQRGFVLLQQQPTLFPHWTVLRNVTFALQLHNKHARNPTATAIDLLKRFHAEQLADRRPADLSTGEQQRVALARAVGAQPRLLLMDEAFSGLDTPLRDELVQELLRWQRSSGVPIISVTHDPAEALDYAGEVIALKSGRVTAQGTPCDVLQSQLEHLHKCIDLHGPII